MRQVKYLVFAITMLWACAVYADLNPQIDSLRTAAFEQSLVPDAGNALIDTTYGKRVINRAIQQVCQDFPAIEKLDTIVSAVGTIEYSLNTDFLRLKNIFKFTTYQDLKIIYSLSFPPAESWFEARAGEIGGQADPNKKADPRYAWSFNDKVYLYPTPQKADSFVISYFAIDSQMIDPTSSTSVRPEFREAIIIYAASLICYRKGDFVRAEVYRRLYNDKRGVSSQ